MKMVCIDFEGVIGPEVWQEVSKATGIKELMRTTKDEPDYAKLMRWRVGILKEHNITIDDVKKVVGGIGVLEGAREFMDDLRTTHQVAILTDSFYDYLTPLFEELGRPMAFAHTLDIDDEGFITDVNFRIEDQKTVAVKAFQDCAFHVIAVGDSYNDLGMIRQADTGILFRCTEQFAKDNSEFACVPQQYDELLKHIRSIG